jgi:hypothetical protein
MIEAEVEATTDAETATAWLPAWMAQQIEVGAAQRATLSTIRGDAMYLYGSIGVDTALTSTGAVYVGEYDIDTFDSAAQSIRWRQVDGVERLGWIVLGARRFAQLHALLPVQSPDATSCPSCRATGDWHISSQDRKESLRIRGTICKQCGGLGWRAPTPSD